MGKQLYHGSLPCYQLKKYIAENQNDLFTDGQLRLMIEHASGNVAGIVDLFLIRCTPQTCGNRDCNQRTIPPARHRIQCPRLIGKPLFPFARHPSTLCLYPDRQYRLPEFIQKLGYTFSATLKDWIYTSRGYKDICIAQKLQINYMKDIEGK